MCKVRGYKRMILASLPKLSNLDGERNPSMPHYTTAIDSAQVASEKLQHHEPNFTFEPPTKWLPADAFNVPDLPAPAGGKLAEVQAATSKRMQVRATIRSPCTPNVQHTLR